VTREDGAVGEPERLHPLLLLTGLGGGLRQVAGGYAFIGYLAFSGRGGTALIAALALLAVLAGGLYLYWRRFEFRVGTNEIRIDSGILSRTHRSIPFDRIQDVDISQGPIARLAGIAKVKFETAATPTKARCRRYRWSGPRSFGRSSARTARVRWNRPPRPRRPRTSPSSQWIRAVSSSPASSISRWLCSPAWSAQRRRSVTRSASTR
jgi:hypothetical protein